MSDSRTFKAALLGSGKFLVTLTGLISAAVLARVLTKTDYAAYRQTFLTYRFVAPFLSMGLPMALYYFLPIDKGHSRSTLSGNLFLLFCMGFLFLGFILCGGNQLLAKRFSNPVLSKLLLIFSPYAIVVLPARAIDACMVSFGKIKTLTIYNIAGRLVVLICIIGLALIWRSSLGAVLGAVSAETLLFFPALFLMYKSTKRDKWLPNKNNMRKQIKYSVPLGLSTTIGTMYQNLDKILVSSLCTPEEFAVYVNGAIEIPLIGVITGSVISILIPEFAEMYQHKKNEEILSLWHRAMLKCALLIFPIMIFLLIMASEIIQLLFSAKYADSTKPFRVYLLLLPIRITTFGSIFMASDNNLLVLYNTTVELALNFILSITLINYMGSIGAAIATVLVTYLWGVPYCLFFIRKILGVKFFRVFPCRRLVNIFLTNVLAAVVFVPKLYLTAPKFIEIIIYGVLFMSATSLLYRQKNWLCLQDKKITI